MSDPVADLKKQWLYEVAQQEVDLSLEGVPDSAHLPLHAIKTLCISCWIRGATWQRQQVSAGGKYE